MVVVQRVRLNFKGNNTHRESLFLVLLISKLIFLFKISSYPTTKSTCTGFARVVRMFSFLILLLLARESSVFLLTFSSGSFFAINFVGSYAEGTFHPFSATDFSVRRVVIINFHRRFAWAQESRVNNLFVGRTEGEIRAWCFANCYADWSNAEHRAPSTSYLGNFGVILGLNQVTGFRLAR